MMQAVVWTKYGSPEELHLREIEKPIPKDNEVLIRVRASTVTAGDGEVRRLDFPPWLWLPLRIYMGVIRPRNVVLGQELSGDIEAVGSVVTRWNVGDAVFAATTVRFGGYAEYTTLSENAVMALKPETMSYEEAAAVPVGGLEALHFLTAAAIQPGERVLINGAGGSIGTFGVQIAKDMGAEVTAVDSAEKLAMLSDLGADHVVDYAREDFSQRGETYDVVFDVVGKGSYSRGMRVLGPRGRYLMANPRFFTALRGRWATATSGRRVIRGAGEQTQADLERLKTLAEAGTIKTVIDRVYPLAETAEAHRYVDTGAKIGNVIIKV